MPDGRVPKVGSKLVNPGLARTLEAIAAEVGFFQVVGLQEDAHGAIDDEDALAAGLGEGSGNVFRHG